VVTSGEDGLRSGERAVRGTFPELTAEGGFQSRGRTPKALALPKVRSKRRAGLGVAWKIAGLAALIGFSPSIVLASEIGKGRCSVPVALQDFESAVSRSEFRFLTSNIEDPPYSDVGSAYASRRYAIMRFSDQYRADGHLTCVRQVLSSIDKNYSNPKNLERSKNPYIGKDMVEIDLIFHLHGNYMDIFSKDAGELFPNTSEFPPGSYLNSNSWEDGFQLSSSVRDLVLSSYALCYSGLADQAHDRRGADILDRSLREIRSRKARGFADSLLVRSLLSDPVFKKCEAEVKHGR